MKQYHELLEKILKYGTKKGDRTGTGTISLFGPQMEFDLADGFPIVTTKKVSFKSIVVELLWFLRGDSNIKYLVDNGVNIWNEDSYNFYAKHHNNANLSVLSFDEYIRQLKESGKILEHGFELGDTGEQYPRLWRKWNTGNMRVIGHTGTHNEWGTEVIDQIQTLIKELKNNPTSRRHILTSWNPSTLDDMALHACHTMVQFNCRPLNLDERYNLYQNIENNIKHTRENITHDYLDLYVPKHYLDCKMYQRSADSMLGVPYNTASYALLTHIFCQICNMVPGRLIHTFGDAHIYQNHIEAAKEQLERNPEKYELPTLVMEYNFEGFELSHIEDIHYSEFKLDNYKSYPKLENETKLNTGLK